MPKPVTQTEFQNMVKKTLDKYDATPEQAEEYVRKGLAKRGLELQLEEEEKPPKAMGMIRTGRGPLAMAPWARDEEAEQVSQQAAQLEAEATPEMAAKTLDYPAGFVRTGIAQATDIGQPGDWTRALEGQGVRGKEMLERYGMEEGGRPSNLPFVGKMYSETGDEWTKLKKGGFLDPSKREFVGGALEMATDPATIGTGGLAQMLKKTPGMLAKMATPISSGLRAGGKKLHKAGLANVLAELPEQQGKKLAELMFKQKSGLPFKKITKSAEGIKQNALEKVGALIDKAQNANVKVKTVDVFDPAFAELDNLVKVGTDDAIKAIPRAEKKIIGEMKALAEKNVPGSTGVGSKWDDIAKMDNPTTQDYLKAMPEEIDILTSHETKKSLNKELHKHYDKQYKNATSSTADHVNDVKEGVARGHRRAIEKAADTNFPEYAGQIKEQNKIAGTVYSAEKSIAKEARKMDRAKGKTVAGLVLGTKDPLLIGGYLGGKAASSPTIRSTAGIGMHALGSVGAGLPETAIMKSAWQSMKPPYTPIEGGGQ
jgi:hypothetical protein